MPITIIVKNIPDALHLALKLAAKNSRRNLNREVIARLEKSLQNHASQAHVHVDRVHALHQSLGKSRRANLANIDAVRTIRADRDRR